MPFQKNLVKRQENFEKNQQNFSKKSGKISQLDLWQPCNHQCLHSCSIRKTVYFKIKCFFARFSAQYDQALDEDFVLDGFWNYLRERGVITDGDLNFLLGNNPHKKTSFEEVKSEVELIAFIRTNIADKDAVVEALISVSFITILSLCFKLSNKSFGAKQKQIIIAF